MLCGREPSAKSSCRGGVEIACPSQRNDYCQLALARWGSARTALSETRIVGQNKSG